MSKIQDAWELIDLDDEQGIERQIPQEKEVEKELEIKVEKSEIDWQIIAGKWEFLFKCAIWVWVISLLIFAYVADSLSTENDYLQIQIEEMQK